MQVYNHLGDFIIIGEAVSINLKESSLICCYICEKYNYIFLLLSRQLLFFTKEKVGIINKLDCIKYIKKSLIESKKNKSSDLWLNIEKDVEYILEDLCYSYSNELLQNKNAIKIQQQFRESISNPEYILCKNRLQKEYKNMTTLLYNIETINNL